MSRTVTDFGIFHGKGALKKGAFSRFCTLIILRKKKTKNVKENIILLFF